MASRQQREQLMQAFLETPEAKLWEEATLHAEFRIRTAEEKGQMDGLLEFLKLVLPEMKENPTMFSVLRDVWNQLAVKMDMPDEIRP